MINTQVDDFGVYLIFADCVIRGFWTKKNRLMAGFRNLAGVNPRELMSRTLCQ